MQNYFITGIGTDVGKTLVAAIVVEALQSDYWKPIQAGDLDHSDTHKVKSLISNKTTHFFDNAYALATPMSPHAAAEIDEVEIQLSQIKRPNTKNNLVIEGAGGLLVPLNSEDSVIDLIQPEDLIILVSRHYLGSINHTLLSIEALQQRGFCKIGIVFSGDEHPTTESIIIKKTNVTYLGRIPQLEIVNKKTVADEAEKLRMTLTEF
jgi:dethiobiotin synthetase